jgi:hypothetical protein
MLSAGAVGTSTAACEGSEDDIVTRIKKMAGGEEPFDINSLTDQVARTTGSKVGPHGGMNAHMNQTLSAVTEDSSHHFFF